AEWIKNSRRDKAVHFFSALIIICFVSLLSVLVFYGWKQVDPEVQRKAKAESEAKRLAEQRDAKERQERAEKEAKEREGTPPPEQRAAKERQAKRRPLVAKLKEVKRNLDELAGEEARLRNAALKSAADRPDIRKRVDKIVKERETRIAERDRLERE